MLMSTLIATKVHVIDIIAILQRFKQGIGETQGEQILHHFLEHILRQTAVQVQVVEGGV